MKINSDYIELHIAAKFDDECKYLLLKRAENNSVYPGIWQPVTGKKENNENSRQTVIRELKEETGLIADKIFSVPRVNTFFVPYIDSIVLSPVFLAFVVNRFITLSEEHTEYKWATFPEAVNLIHWQNQIESLRLIENFIKNPLTKNNFMEIQL